MGHSTSHSIESLITKAGLKRPKRLTLELTDRCNLQCNHCWLDCSPHKTGEIPKEKLEILIHEFTELGGTQISLAGGEPLLHPDWFNIVAVACRMEKLTEVQLQTNGTLISEKAIAQIGCLDSEKLSIQVSLDGATADHHDYVRGKGSFASVIRGLNLLSQAKLGYRVCVAFTEMKHNFDDIPDLLNLVDDLQFERFISHTLLMGGRAAESASLEQPEPAQYRRLLEKFSTDRRFQEQYRRIGNIAALEWYLNRQRHTNAVCTCIESPFITIEGIMYPCIMLHHPGFATSGVYQRPLQDVIRDGLKKWSDLPRMHRRRLESLSMCASCPGRQHCAGGCMGRAYTAHGDLVSVEDRCALRRMVYTWQQPSAPDIF